jgi:hypothetical protein
LGHTEELFVGAGTTDTSRLREIIWNVEMFILSLQGYILKLIMEHGFRFMFQDRCIEIRYSDNVT